MIGVSRIIIIRYDSYFCINWKSEIFYLGYNWELSQSCWILVEKHLKYLGKHVSQVNISLEIGIYLGRYVSQVKYLFGVCGPKFYLKCIFVISFFKKIYIFLKIGFPLESVFRRDPSYIDE